MAYRYTGGLSLDDLLNIDPERLINMPKPELRETVSRMAQAANKRLERGLKREYPSPAVAVANRGGEFSTAGKDIAALRNEYTRARIFLTNPTSTASGYNDMLRNVKDSLKERDYNVKNEDIPKLIDSYRQLTEEDGTVLTRGERYRYLRDMGHAVGITEKDAAEKTGAALLNILADILGDLGGEDYEFDNGGVAGYFRELE